MLTTICPKLPMRDKALTRDFYINKLGFTLFGSADHPGYLMLQREGVQLHFFEHRTLDPAENYGQVYIRTDAIDDLYRSFLSNGAPIHLNGKLENKPWGQREFSILDPDSNLLTFGQNL